MSLLQTSPALPLALLLTAGLLATGAATGAAAGTAAPAAGRAQTRTYVPSSAPIANPDRGFYHYTETHYSSSGSGYTSLDAPTLTRWRTEEDVTLVYRIFYLEKFVDLDSIDDAYLHLVAQDLAAARAAGVKLVARFAYSSSSSADAPAARVVRHIGQLAPVLNAGADVLAALQAGFIGQWGEWYYTDNFAGDPGRPWALNDADWTLRGQVLAALVQETVSSVKIQVRYPAIKQRLLPSSPRVGVHNDCFLASADDYGTFANESDRAWLAEQTRSVPMGGETCAVNAPRSSWPSAESDLAAYHWSFLNADYNSDVLSSWGADGLNSARLRLGYRLRMVGSVLPTSAAAGGVLSLQLTLTNDGYAAPFNARPVQLVLSGNSGTYRRTLPVDIRQVAPDVSVTVSAQVPAPSRPGWYKLYLALPDAAPRLASRPAYSVHLANVGTWNAARGWNTLQQGVSVTP